MTRSRSRPPLLASLHFEPLAFSQPQETGAISSQPAGLVLPYSWLLTASPDLVQFWVHGPMLFISKGIMVVQSNRHHPPKTSVPGCW